MKHSRLLRQQKQHGSHRPAVARKLALGTSCRVCGREGVGTRCRWCARACSRKQRHPTYRSAREHLAEIRENVWDDPTLHVYVCPDNVEEHFHVGHAVGAEAVKLRRRAERLHRRAVS